MEHLQTQPLTHSYGRRRASQDRSKYATAPTLALVKAIVQDADRGALNCLIDERNVFRVEGRACLLPEFLLSIRNSKGWMEERQGAGRELEERLDRAYDQTLNRFFNLPDLDVLSSDEADSEIDCRNQYRVVQSRMRTWRHANRRASELAEEQETGRILQSMVAHHFYQYGWSDACRTPSPLQQRYFWKSSGQTIELRRPITIDAHTFRQWLQVRCGDQDLSEPGVRDRIQREVDARFERLYYESWDAELHDQLGPCSEDDAIEQEQSASLLYSLARIVAAEKAANLTDQRPSIQQLGRERIYWLVSRTVCEVIDESHDAERLANEVGLSKASMSRFAGTQWNTTKDKDGSAVPDLWQNVAHLLVSDHRFVEGLLDEGVPGVRERLQELANGGHDE